MASNGKKKTTMAKLNRERRLQEKRLDKQARKVARKAAADNPAPPDDGEEWLDAVDGDEAAEDAPSPAPSADQAPSPAASADDAPSPAPSA